MECQSGQTIGSYRLLEKCGAGSYGSVWLAQNVYSQRRVALKVLALSDELVERELRGLANYRDCRHPNLLQIHHIDRLDGRIFYTMDAADDAGEDGRYVPDTLAHRLSKRGRLPVDEIRTMTNELLDGLACLHKHGLVHRDIKPDNILWVDGRATLADIGLASFVDNASLVGTPGYMSEDLVSGKRAASPQDDLYALGKVVYCALTGCPADKFPHFPPDATLAGAAPLIRTYTAVCQSDSRVRTSEEMRALLNAEIGESNSNRTRKGLKFAWAPLLALALLVGAALFLADDVLTRPSRGNAAPRLESEAEAPKNAKEAPREPDARLIRNSDIAKNAASLETDPTDALRIDDSDATSVAPPSPPRASASPPSSKEAFFRDGSAFPSPSPRKNRPRIPSDDAIMRMKFEPPPNPNLTLRSKLRLGIAVDAAPNALPSDAIRILRDRIPLEFVKLKRFDAYSAQIRNGAFVFLPAFGDEDPDARAKRLEASAPGADVDLILTVSIEAESLPDASADARNLVCRFVCKDALSGRVAFEATEPLREIRAAAASAETQDVLDAALHVLPTAFRLLREAFPASAKVAVMSGDRVILTDAEECGFDPESPALLCASVFGRSVPVAFAVYDSNFPPEASFLKVRRWNDSDEDAKPVVETIRKEPSWYMWNDLRAVERPLPDGNAPQRSAAKATMAQENSRRNADAP